MGVNRNLHQAKSAKNDDFRTQLSDIEKELKHYKKHFKGKVVYCNCDDPRISNFFHYFSYNFEVLGLKRLITTCYKNKQMDLFSQNKSEKAICLEYEGQRNEGKIPTKDRIKNYPLDGDGDFRSEECINLLKQSDIVVTNPPFSLFSEYVNQLMQFKKKFLILGDQNSVTYKGIFNYIKDNRLWLGYDNGGTKWFQVPMDYDISTESRKKIVNGTKYFSMGRILWFTNLDTTKRHEEMILYKKYNEKEFPKYDSFDIINVDKVSNIPMDYDGVMGVPITFVSKYNPEQFEILGIANSARWIGYKCFTLIKGKKIYNRILIKRK